ncbi:MAG: hypothetical protein IPI72_12255 [Flavobacteriales bacterium]|nr:hypothetical protein [Flavobacteriales bacterium]
MDGDRYPDILNETQIQGTTPWGGYEATPRSFYGNGHSSESTSEGTSVGGSFSKPNFSNTANPSSGMVESVSSFIHAISKNQENSQKSTESAKTTIGLSVNGSNSQSEDETSVTWFDVNGDGLPDKVDGNEVRLNLGRSFLPPETWPVGGLRSGSSADHSYGGGVSIVNLSFSAGVSASGTENGTLGGLTDVNGDGLIDMVHANAAWMMTDVQFNTGTGFEDPIAWETGANGLYDAGSAVGEAVNGSYSYGFNIPLPPIRFVFNVNGSKGGGFSRTETQFADINGDSYPDFLFSQNDDHVEVRSSTIRRTNLLKAVQSPFGASWEVDYSVAGNTYELPSSKWVLSEVLLVDGLSSDGPDTLRKTFAYADGQYDRREREQYGFGTVSTMEWDTEDSGTEPYRTTVQTYDVSGYYTKGLPLVKTVLRGTVDKFLETVNTYDLRLLSGGSLPPNFNADNDDGSAFPALIRTDESQYEGGPSAGLTRTVTYAYDAIGNVTTYSDLGMAGDDAVVATITYHDIDPLYIEGIPATVSVDVGGQLQRNEAGRSIRRMEISRGSANPLMKGRKHSTTSCTIRMATWNASHGR